MNTSDDSFRPHDSLHRAVELLMAEPGTPAALPATLPEVGLGEQAVLELLAPLVLGGAAKLDAPTALAHMDPPTPWITWAMSLWNARLNQNLLHTATAPFAIEAESSVIAWLAPMFGMRGGHFCSGSTIANLTALWAARDAGGVRDVVASAAAHLSIAKAARILGLPCRSVAANESGVLDADGVGDLDASCLVLTAGTTTTGAVDPLTLAGRARWTHVDAAWAGPLRLSDRHADILEGIQDADSVAVSAHKWLFQPKDSALILFRDPDRSSDALSLSGSYLASPNVGVQGSRGAAAIPLLATLIAFGRRGIADRIDRTMKIARFLYERLESDRRIETWGPPRTAINVFRPVDGEVDELFSILPAGTLSTCRLDDHPWLRSVAANPLADPADVLSAIDAALGGRKTRP